MTYDKLKRIEEIWHSTFYKQLKDIQRNTRNQDELDTVEFVINSVVSHLCHIKTNLLTGVTDEDR